MRKGPSTRTGTEGSDPDRLGRGDRGAGYRPLPLASLCGSTQRVRRLPSAAHGWRPRLGTGYPGLRAELLMTRRPAGLSAARPGRTAHAAPRAEEHGRAISAGGTEAAQGSRTATGGGPSARRMTTRSGQALSGGSAHTATGSCSAGGRLPASTAPPRRPNFKAPPPPPRSKWNAARPRSRATDPRVPPGRGGGFPPTPGAERLAPYGTFGPRNACGPSLSPKGPGADDEKRRRRRRAGARSKRD